MNVYLIKRKGKAATFPFLILTKTKRASLCPVLSTICLKYPNLRIMPPKTFSIPVSLSSARLLCLGLSILGCR